MPSRRRSLLIFFAVILLSVGWTAWRLNAARQHLQTAKASLSGAREALLDRDVPRASELAQRAGKETAQARDAVDDPVVWLWAHLPLVGHNVAVVKGLSEVADDVARKALPPALDVAGRVDPAALRRADGSVDVRVLEEATPSAEQARAAAAAAQRRSGQLPSNLLLGPVASARRTFTAELDELATTLRQATQGLRVAPTFLGRDGTRRWLVVVQQYGESRGTGGLVGGYAVLQAEAGRLRVVRSGSNADLKGVHVVGKGIPGDFRARYELDGSFDLWPNVNLSPDFPVVARLMGQLYAAGGGGRVDGVVSLDATSLSLLLRGGPAIDVGGGRSVTAEQLPDYLSVGQYEGVRVDPTGLATRKDRLAATASAVLGRLTSGGGDSKALLTGVVDALRSGHVRFSTDDAGISRVLAGSAVRGGLPTGNAPIAYPVVNNASGSKLDYFLGRRLIWTGDGCFGGRRATTVTVELTNNAPARASLPSYVTTDASAGLGGSSDAIRLLLDVYATRGATLVSATLDGQAVSTMQNRTRVRLQSSTEGGLPVWRIPLDVPRGETSTFTLHLSEPTSSGAPRVPVQPLARPLVSDISLKACRG